MGEGSVERAQWALQLASVIVVQRLGKGGRNFYRISSLYSSFVNTGSYFYDFFRIIRSAGALDAATLCSIAFSVLVAGWR